jgi:RHS repeat-associated protein
LKAFFIQANTEEPSTYTQYFYDASGNRVKKISRTQGGSSTQTTVYIDGIFEHTVANSSEVIPNLQIGSWKIGYGSGEQNVLHIMDDASRIATIRIGDAMGDTAPALKFNLEDHLGSSNLSLDINSSLVSKEEYYPFGETSFGSYGKKRYRFCGKEKDEESGLYYYGMRYYNPWTCRFINIDPLAQKYAHLTPYAYADNKPINHTDIDGAETGSTNETPKDGNNIGRSQKGGVNTGNMGVKAQHTSGTVDENEACKNENISEKSSSNSSNGAGGAMGLHTGLLRMYYAAKSYSLKAQNTVGGKIDYNAGIKARTDLKAEVRSATPAPWSKWLDAKEGPITSPSNPKARFWKTNMGYNGMGTVSIGIGVYSIRNSLLNIASSKDPVGQTIVEGTSFGGGIGFMRAVSPYATKIKNKYVSAGVIIGAGMFGSYASYRATQLGVSQQQYTQQLSDKVTSSGLINITKAEPIVHSELEYCAYCNGIAAKGGLSAWWTLNFTDPSGFHPSNYVFSDWEKAVGVGTNKVHPKYK